MALLTRLDVALLRIGEALCKKKLEPKVGGFPLWDEGLGEVAAEMVKEAGVPSEALTMVEIARGVGLLKKPRRIRSRGGRP